MRLDLGTVESYIVAVRRRVLLNIGFSIYHLSFFERLFDEKACNNMTSQNNREKHYAANLAGTNKLEKEIMEYDVFFPTKELEFEGKKYPCPNQIDQYLKKLYGNFMELPPMENVERMNQLN